MLRKFLKDKMLINSISFRGTIVNKTNKHEIICQGRATDDEQDLFQLRELETAFQEEIIKPKKDQTFRMDTNGIIRFGDYAVHPKKLGMGIAKIDEQKNEQFWHEITYFDSEFNTAQKSCAIFWAIRGTMDFIDTITNLLSRKKR